MDTYRFFAPDLSAHAAANSPITLSEDQSKHAALVLRLTPNTPIELFDGQGHSAPALITQSTHKHKVSALLQSPPQLSPPPPIALTLATAIPKGDRADWLVEQASQLNVTQILWLDTDRSVAKIKDEHKLEKFRRLAQESAKQCGRNYLLHIDLAPSLQYLLSHSQDTLLWLEPREGGTTISQVLAKSSAKKITALIGPEGGWSPKEFALLESAANNHTLTRIRLTPTILRIETAALALAALITAT